MRESTEAGQNVEFSQQAAAIQGVRTLSLGRQADREAHPQAQAQHRLISVG